MILMATSDYLMMHQKTGKWIKNPLSRFSFHLL